MPSLLGHALGGLVAGWMVDGRARATGAPGAPGLVASLRAGAPFALVGMAPDLDLLVGLHSMYTHSVGAVAVVTLAAWTMHRGRGVRWALACGAALASHILLDWLGSDTTAPIGIMALWPFTTDYYQSALHLFPAVSRRFGEWSFVVQNTRAAVFEIVVLVPVAAAAGWMRGTPGVETPGATEPHP